MVNTLVYVAAIVPVSAALGLALAVLFDTRFPLRELFKAVYFAPMVTSTAAAAMVWWWLYNPQFGLFNVLLRLAHLPDQPWLMSGRTALTAIIIFSVWKSLGYNIVINSQELRTLPVGIALFKDPYGSINYGPLMAATVIASGPMLLAYAVSQKFMIRGIALTGLRG